MLLLYGYYALLTGMIVFGGYRLVRSLQNFRMQRNYTAALDAPSVSICIPARNETHAMTQCLERTLKSTYPKLEIIVYDDSSHDDTSVLIRSFAHAGVRFVPGVALPEGWMGKNHALQALALQASGTYVVFMDVDTAIEPTSISQLVGYVLSENLAMTSVIPRRYDVWRASVLFGHLRYFWELIFSRRDMPATSSSLWMIHRTTLLEELGGFTQLKAAAAPEVALAARLADRYRCLVGTHMLGVSYEKKWLSQAETSRRQLYPRVGGVWWRASSALFFITCLILPTIIIGWSFATSWTLLSWLACFYQVVLMGLYGVFTRATWNSSWLVGALLWPIVIVQELLFFVSSWVGYVRGTITWKGRAVSAPTERVSAMTIDQ